MKLTSQSHVQYKIFHRPSSPVWHSSCFTGSTKSISFWVLASYLLRRMHSLVSYARHHSPYCHLGPPSTSCRCLARSRLSIRHVRHDIWVAWEGWLTDKHFSYCSNIGLHSSVVAVPRRNSKSLLTRANIDLTWSILSLYHFRKQLS